MVAAQVNVKGLGKRGAIADQSPATRHCHFISSNWQRLSPGRHIEDPLGRAHFHESCESRPVDVTGLHGSDVSPGGLSPSSRLSGKAMARTGLRMMPTFPLPPLKFRTAGFPRYGFKAGLSNEAFPVHWFAIVLRALCCHRVFPALCQG